MEQKQTQKIMKQATYWMGVIAIGLALGVGIQFARAWSEPTQNPPNGNVAAPLNVGPNGQSKQGNLVLNTSGDYSVGLTVNGISRIQSGGVQIIARSGDWGEGILYKQSNLSTNLGGIGMRGNDDNETYLYMMSTPGGGNPRTVQNGLIVKSNGLVSIGSTNPPTRVTGSSRERLFVNGAVNLDDFAIGSFNEDEYNTLNDLKGPWLACVTSGQFSGSCGLRIGPNADSNDFFVFGYDKDQYAKIMAYSYWSKLTNQTYSDVRLKKDIETISDPVSKLMQIRGTSFIRTDAQGDDINKRQLGVVAQEIENVFPELISLDQNGYRGVKYEGFTGVFIEAIKEQQKQIEDLQRQIDELKNR